MLTHNPNDMSLNHQYYLGSVRADSGFDQWFGLYLAIGLIIVIGYIARNMIRLYLERKQEHPYGHFSFYRFAAQQCLLVLQHPMRASFTPALIPLLTVLWPFLWILDLAGMFGPMSLDVRRWIKDWRYNDLKADWQAANNWDYRPYASDASCRDYHRAENAYLREQELKADEMRRPIEWIIFLGGYAVLGIIVATAPFCIFVKAAKATTKEEDETAQPVENDEFEKPNLPIGPNFHGVVLHQLSLSDAFGEPEASWQFRSLKMAIVGQPSKTISYVGVVDFAYIGRDVDPVFMACGTWSPTEATSIQIGRIAVPVGLDRSLPGEKKTELTYARTALSSPLFDHGVVASTGFDILTLNLGVVTGNGTEIVPDNTPDVFARVQISPWKLVFGMAGQTGGTEYGRRSNASAYATMTFEHLSLAMEYTGSRTPTETDITIAHGWWVLGTWSPGSKSEIYVRLDKVWNGDNVPFGMILGTNLHPTKGVGIRPALTLPLNGSTIGTHIATQVSF